MDATEYRIDCILKAVDWAETYPTAESFQALRTQLRDLKDALAKRHAQITATHQEGAPAQILEPAT